MYGEVPPEAVRLAVPLQAPKHVTFVDDLATARGDPGCVTDAVAVTVHPLLSVTVTV